MICFFFGGRGASSPGAVRLSGRGGGPIVHSGRAGAVEEVTVVAALDLLRVRCRADGGAGREEDRRLEDCPNDHGPRPQGG